MLKHRTLRTLQTHELLQVAGGYTDDSLANDKSCNVCETEICEF